MDKALLSEKVLLTNQCSSQFKPVLNYNNFLKVQNIEQREIGAKCLHNNQGLDRKLFFAQFFCQMTKNCCIVLGKDYGRPMKHYYIEIQNFWAWAEKLGR